MSPIIDLSGGMPAKLDISGGDLPAYTAWKFMLRLTKKSDYALMALKHLAEHPGNPTQSAKDMAEAYHIPPPLLAKILQTLARSGLVISHAGLYGGYSLARPASEITAFEVIRSIEGPLFIVSCTTSHGDCDLLNSCIVKEPLRKLNDTIRDLLNDMRISDLCDESKLGTSGMRAVFRWVRWLRWAVPCRARNGRKKYHRVFCITGEHR